MYGYVYAFIVGATNVGSIKVSVSVGEEVDMMQEIGYFQMGGSTVILLSEMKLKIRREVLGNSNAQIETYIKVGNSLAFLD